MAANTLALLDRLGLEGEVTIAERGGSLLAMAPKKAREQIFGFLTAKGARVLTNTPVTSFSSGVDPRRARNPLRCTRTRDGDLAAGRFPRLKPHHRPGRWPLGGQNLRSVNHRCLFGSGDCISYRGEALPKLGVFAVRQGPVLFHNLQAALEGEPLKPYKPQKRFLYILNLGDGTGPAVYGSLVWRGRLSFMLKHRIDEKFVSHYRR